MNPATPPDAQAYLRVMSNVDFWVRLACLCDAAELERCLDAGLSVQVILDHEFERRFPAQHAAWVAKVEKA